MEITHENQIDGEWAYNKRKLLGMSQTDFWAPALVSKGMASSHESGRPITGKAQRLLFLRYVLNIPFGDHGEPLDVPEGFDGGIDSARKDLKGAESLAREAANKLKLASSRVR